MHQDTVRLLRECSEGIEMGLGAIDRILPRVHSPQLRQSLLHCRHRHRSLSREIGMYLEGAGIRPKKLHPLAAAMARMEIRWKMLVRPSDRTAAGLIRKGCGMGISSLQRLLEQYPGASEAARDLTRALIESETLMEKDCRAFV